MSLYRVEFVGYNLIKMIFKRRNLMGLILMELSEVDFAGVDFDCIESDSMRIIEI